MNNTLIIDPFQTASATLLQIHNYSAVPALVFLWVSSLIIFVISGLVLLDKEKSNMMKFFGIWLVYAVLTGLVLIWLCYSPNSVQVIKSFIVGFFTW